MPHFITTRRVEFCDTDMAGIIHFANYYRYMEQAEHELFRAVGLKIHATLPDGTTFGWPRVSAACSFNAPAYYDDVLEVRVTIHKRSGRSLTTHYEFVRGDVVIATGEMKTAYCLIPPGEALRSAAIPEAAAAALDALVHRHTPLRAAAAK